MLQLLRLFTSTRLATLPVPRLGTLFSALVLVYTEEGSDYCTITGDYWAITCDYLRLLTITQRLLVSSSVASRIYGKIKWSGRRLLARTYVRV